MVGETCGTGFECGCEKKRKESGYDSQLLQRGLDVRKFKEGGPVRDLLVIEHETDAPYSGREANVLDARQVVKNDIGINLSGHIVLS